MGYCLTKKTVYLKNSRKLKERHFGLNMFTLHRLKQDPTISTNFSILLPRNYTRWCKVARQKTGQEKINTCTLNRPQMFMF